MRKNLLPLMLSGLMLAGFMFSCKKETVKEAETTLEDGFVSYTPYHCLIPIPICDFVLPTLVNLKHQP